MRTRSFIAISWIGALVILLLIPTHCPAASLTILHTNDTHSHLFPFSYPALDDPCAPADLPGRSEIGGIARRATVAKRIRAELAAQGVAVWLIDAGDFTGGSPFSVEYKGEADVEAMNATGYTFAALGNHEFNTDLAQLQRLIALARFPILCANARLQYTKAPLTEEYRIVDVGGVRVGVFGLVTIEARSYPAAKEGVNIADPIKTARRLAPWLRALGADIILLISHCGVEVDREIAAAVPGIDVIIGGHSHSRLPRGEQVFRQGGSSSGKVNGTILLQAFQWGGELGRCDLYFKKGEMGWGISHYRARLIPLSSAIEPDPEVQRVVDRYWKPIAPYYGEVIGEAADDFTGKCGDFAEYNLVADAVREIVGTDIALENMGGVRAPLLRGRITRADLVAMDPFTNTVVTFTITGRKLKRILQRYAPAVSGMRYRLEDGVLVESTINGEPLQDSRRYKGATNSYFAMRALKGSGVRYEDTGKRRLEVLTEYIRKKGVIYPRYDGRRVVVGGMKMP